MPKVMHQTWKTEQLLPFQQVCWDSWQPHLDKRGWSRVLWTDDMIEAFVHEHFAWYLPVWNKMHPFIKKVDTFRYMLLWHQGGLYVDMDIEALHAGPLLKRLEVDPAQSPICFIPTCHFPPTWRRNKDAASPALIASTPKHPFWLHMLLYIAEHHSLAKVIEATGPIALSNALLDWKCEENMVLLSESKAGIGQWAFFRRKKWCRHANTTLWGGGSGTGATGENRLSEVPEHVRIEVERMLLNNK